MKNLKLNNILKNKYLTGFLFFIFSSSLFLGHQYLYSYQSIRLVFVISASAYYLTGLFFFKKLNPSFLPIFIFTNLGWWFIVGYSTDFFNPWWWAIDILFLLLPFLFGYLVSIYSDNKRSFLLPAFALALALASVYFLFIPYSEFTSRLSEKMNEKAPIWLYSAIEHLPDSSEKSEKRILFLDFWFTRCGSCFKGFKELQTLHDFYKDNPDVSVYAVHNGSGGPKEIEQGIRRVRKLGYDFPILVDTSGIFKQSNLAIVYPSQLLIDQHGVIQYRIVGYGADSKAWQVNWVKRQVSNLIN